MSVSVRQFGAQGDGFTDDYAAIQAALDSGEREIVIPQGIYPISGTLRVHSHTRITAAGDAKLIMRGEKRRQRGDFLLTNADPEAGNTDIVITGGIWDGGNTCPANEKPAIESCTGYSGAVLNFTGVTNLTLRDMVVANSVTFYIRMSRLEDFVIENISFVSDKPGYNQDGLHFGGAVHRGTVKKIRALSYGQTNDDLIALNADDCVTRVENLDLVRDEISDITLENIYAESCHSIIRMASVTAPIRRIRFKNVYGGFRVNAINADALRYCRTPILRDEDYPDGVGILEDITLENFTCYPATPGAKTALLLEENAHRFVIRNFRALTPEYAAPDYAALRMKNVTNQCVTADGTEYAVTKRSDELTLNGFASLTIDRTENVT